MKSFITFSRLLPMATAIIFASCNKSQNPHPQVDAVSKTSISSASTKATSTSSSIKGSSQANKYVYYAEWDGWGRSSRSCNGWGLCHFYDCWFCDGDGGSGGGANTEGRRHRGQVVFDETTKEGELIIELDPSRSDERDAIVNRSTFYVDQDINNTNSILHAGAYSFDPSVGASGGYRVAITMINF